MPGSNCCFLICLQISQEAGKVAWYSHLFKNFQFVVIHTVKGFSLVSEAEVDVFLAPLLFLWSKRCWQFEICSSAFSKSSLYIWKSLVHILLNPGWKDFEYHLASMWNVCSCAVVWTFFGIPFLWDWNENWTFQSFDHCWVSQICLRIECSTLTVSSFSFEIAQLEFRQLHDLFVVWFLGTIDFMLQNVCL